MKLIELEQVVLKRGGQLLLEEVNLTLRAGEQAVIRGPSGCGKSSLLAAVAGLLPVDSGRIVLAGKTLGPDSIQAIRGRIAFIGQEPLLGAETVRGALLLPFTFRAHRRTLPDEARIRQVLTELRLPETVLERAADQISGGEKQRLAIARALLLGKDIFLADEITSALDAESRQAVLTLLGRPEFTLLAVAHDPEFITARSRNYRVENRHLLAEE